MPLTVDEMDAIVVGHWNLAILSPQWIASRLLGVPIGQQIPVLVSMDYATPNRIRSERLGVEVRPYADKLHIVSLSSKFEELRNCLQIASSAMESLPVTPVFAAGYNIRLHQDTEQAQIAELLASALDRRLSELQLPIQSRVLTRKLDWHDGDLNLTVSPHVQGGYSIGFNFHKSSSDRMVLRAWLEQPVEEIRRAVVDISDNAIRCGVLEEADDTD